MQKRDSNFLLYENQSIMNTKIRTAGFVLLLCVSPINAMVYPNIPGCYGIPQDLRTLTNSHTTTLVFVTEIIVDKDILRSFGKSLNNCHCPLGSGKNYVEAVVFSLAQWNPGTVTVLLESYFYGFFKN
jgi:hypothetical protein